MNPDHFCIGKSFFVVHKYFKIFLNSRAKEYGLNGAQFLFLHRLTMRDGLSQEEINEELSFDKGFLARIAKSLEQGGYIVRKVNPEDRRAYKLFLTDKGKALESTVFRTLDEWDNAILDDVTEEEIEVIKNVFNGMIKRAAKKSKEEKEGK